MQRAVKVVSPALALCLGISLGQAANAADPEQGETLFKTICATCHSIEPGSHRTGPSLYKLLGRPAGAEPGFDYSESFQEAYAAGVVWTPETLEKFVKRPRSVVKGNKMAYLGLRDDAERADLMAYLKNLSQ